jgi:hypothetical protein
MNKHIKNKILLSLLLPICFWGSSNNINSNNIISHIDNNVSLNTSNLDLDNLESKDDLDDNYNTDNTNNTNGIDEYLNPNIGGYETHHNFNNGSIISNNNINNLSISVILGLVSILSLTSLRCLFFVKRKTLFSQFYLYLKNSTFIFKLKLFSSFITTAIQSNQYNFLNFNFKKINMAQYFIHIKYTNP